MKRNCLYKILLGLSICLVLSASSHATNYSVNTLSTLVSRMTAAVAGDTIIVRDGAYNWGPINFTNTNNTSSSNWIVLKAQTFNGVIFTGNTYLQFAGTRILVTGFRFANGSVGTKSVIQFRNSSNVAANYCRVNNITIDNYNSDSSATADPANPGVGIDNKWVSLYGTNNRVDHCTFINKFNAGATVVVWYDEIGGAYPGQSTSTYHRIDSNYFNGRGYLAGNGGESVRVGTGAVSRSFGYNVVEYNLFENMVQSEPEIISNKTCFNTYRYNTFKNCSGGLTLRTARYCNVYGNFFIVDNPAVTNSYGIRIIDKGHKVFNNYIEGVNGNSGSITSLRCPIILYNGQYPTNDTLNPVNSGGYCYADSYLVDFNTIVNCKGGAGITLAHTDNSTLPFQPLGMIISNNIIKMATGQAAYKDPLSTTATYFAEGNKYDAPSGLGNISPTGFTATTLSFGTRQNGILSAPALVQDAAINTIAYAALLNLTDVQGQARSSIYDIGSDEINGTGAVWAYPLDATLVGAGTPPAAPLPVRLITFNATALKNATLLKWQIENEINFKQYELEYSTDGVIFKTIATVAAANLSFYNYTYPHTIAQKEYYRLKLIDNDGRYAYSKIISLYANGKLSVNVFPNPAQEYIIVEANGTITDQIEIILYNAFGQQVKKVMATSNATKIVIQHLSKGLYHLQITQKNGETGFYPFLIQ
jgi:poly(beta-D-mannuronate) lyase